MFRLLVDEHIPFIEKYFLDDFETTRFHHQQNLEKLLKNQDILIVRSMTPVTQKIIANSNLKIVATASSGKEHIDITALKEKKIQFFSAIGANAHAVCDYITSILAYLIITTTISPRAKIAIIGYGHVGSMVYKRLKSLGFDLGVYDPFKFDCPHAIKWSDLSHYDVLCLHPNYHQNTPHPSHMMMNKNLITKLKPKVCIINAARGKIVNEDDILNVDFQGTYCTDVYWNEPHINPAIITKALLCTPHIAGHTKEAKERITALLSQHIHDYLGLSTHTPQISNPKTILLPCQNWETRALELYNPLPETKALKQNCNAEHFIQLRRAHTFRHDFPWEP
jgi:erythronate-4-phosphate dehydrogenase